MNGHQATGPRTPSAWSMLLRRFFVPRHAVTLYHLFKSRSKVSPRAEVEFTPNVQFGPRCTVGSFTKIKATRGPLRVGKRAGIGTCCFIDSGEQGVHIGDHLLCGPNVSIVGVNYHYDRIGVPLDEQGCRSIGIRIGDNVWIGAGTTILDGTVIGENSIVVANSLLNRRYPPNSIIGGNPARILRRRVEAAAPAPKVPIHA